MQSISFRIPKSRSFSSQRFLRLFVVLYSLFHMQRKPTRVLAFGDRCKTKRKLTSWQAHDRCAPRLSSSPHSSLSSTPHLLNPSAPSLSCFTLPRGLPRRNRLTPFQDAFARKNGPMKGILIEAALKPLECSVRDRSTTPPLSCKPNRN